jgi:thiamine-phosphate pyrophosphorylase
MARSQPVKMQVPAPRLYLMTPAVTDAAAFARDLGAALASDADIAAVLLRLAPGDERTQVNRIKTLASIVQDQGIALVIEGHPEFVARGGADGAQLPGIEAFVKAAETLKPARIAGCAGLASRHDAMTAAERGADYVVFGDAADGHRPALPAIVERVAWWAEVFEVPCVVCAESFDEIEPLAAAGPDFIAVGDFIWSDARGVAAALNDVSRRLAQEMVG